MVKRLILAAVVAATLTACQTMQGDFCDIAKPLRPTAEQVDSMSDAQVRELLSHNRKGEKLCRWKP
jgi:predicted small secreted protein